MNIHQDGALLALGEEFFNLARREEAALRRYTKADSRKDNFNRVADEWCRLSDACGDLIDRILSTDHQSVEGLRVYAAVVEWLSRDNKDFHAKASLRLAHAILRDQAPA
jgi:hypothetical protein